MRVLTAGGEITEACRARDREVDRPRSIDQRVLLVLIGGNAGDLGDAGLHIEIQVRVDPLVAVEDVRRDNGRSPAVATAPTAADCPRFTPTILPNDVSVSFPSTSVKSHFDDFCSFFSCFLVLTTVKAVPDGRLHLVTNAVPMTAAVAPLPFCSNFSVPDSFWTRFQVCPVLTVPSTCRWPVVLTSVPSVKIVS